MRLNTLSLGYEYGNIYTCLYMYISIVVYNHHFPRPFFNYAVNDLIHKLPSIIRMQDC